MSAKCEPDTLLANSEVARLTSVCEVADQQLALRYTSGEFDGVLRRGNMPSGLCWSVTSTSLWIAPRPRSAEDVPQCIFAKLPTTVYTKVEVAHVSEKHGCTLTRSRLHFGTPAPDYFWKNNIRVDVNLATGRLPGTEADYWG